MNETRPLYTAHFTPEAWVRDQPIEVDAEGPQTWDCTAYAEQNQDYLNRLEAHGESLDSPDGVLDNDDMFKDDPNAPEWIRTWHGPFDISITRRIESAAMPPPVPNTCTPSKTTPTHTHKNAAGTHLLAEASVAAWIAGLAPVDREYVSPADAYMAGFTAGYHDRN